MVAQNSSPTVLAGLAAIGALQAPVGLAATSLNALINGKIVASVSGNALTVAVKTLDDSDPSPTNPVFTPFRDQSLTTGGTVIRSIEAALSLTIPSGAAFASNSLPFRLWWELFDDGGTLRLAVVRCQSDPDVLPLPEFGVSNASDIASFSYSAGTFYANAAITAKPFRIIAYTEWTSGLANATLWTAVPDVIQLFGPGIKKPGDLVRLRANYDASQFNGVVAIPLDNTAPQIGEGSQAIAVAVTPTSPCNSFEWQATIHVARSTAGPLIMAIFRDDNTDARGIALGSPNADELTTIRCGRTEPANKATAITFSARYGGTGGATVYLNSTSTGGLFGGFLLSEIIAKEIMG